MTPEGFRTNMAIRHARNPLAGIYHMWNGFPEHCGNDEKQDGRSYRNHSLTCYHGIALLSVQFASSEVVRL
jgi:hypothetical protein